MILRASGDTHCWGVTQCEGETQYVLACGPHCQFGGPQCCVGSPFWRDSTNPALSTKSSVINESMVEGHSGGSQETLRTYRHNTVGVNLGLWHPLCTPRNWGHWQLHVPRERHPPSKGTNKPFLGGTHNLPDPHHAKDTSSTYL